MRSDLKIRTTVSSTARAPSAKASEHVLDLASPCTTKESSCFKENVNINKSETPKLCVEPLQMKRKKKGGGYNLRKSLAWDKAFFTEEGVLDAIELSVISGASGREGLPFINEETAGRSQLPLKPLDRQKLEKNPLKEMQDESLVKDGKKDWSSPKSDSSSINTMTSTSLISHKLPTHLGSKSGSRCGDCPRPLPSSSLKRPANVNIGTAAGKDLKLPKVPGLKPNLSPIYSTTTSTTVKANCVKHNPITKPDFNFQRTPGSKSFSKSLQNTQSALKASSHRPDRYSDGNSGNSSLKRHSSVNSSQDSEFVSGSKNISDITTPDRTVKSSQAQLESTSFAAAFSRNARVGGMTMHHLQNQPMKPSGLRMPSPSLSFFSQPKRLVIHNLQSRGNETEVCWSQKPENSRLQDNSKRTSKIDNDIPVSAISIGKVISSSSECMASSHVSADEVVKQNWERKSMLKIPDISENKTGRITNEERELQKIDIELPSGSGSREQVMHDKFSRKAIEGYREEACKPDYHQPHMEQPDPSKDSVGESDKKTDKDKVVSRTKERASEHLGVSQLNESWYGESASVEALKHSQPKAQNLDLGSKHLRANLLNDAFLTEVSTDVLMEEVHLENAVSASSVGGCTCDISLISEIDDDISQSGTVMESPRNVESNTSDRLLPERQICLQSSLEDRNVDKLMFVVPDRKDGNTEFNFVDNSLTSGSPSTLINVSFNRDFKGNADVLSNNPANKNLSSSLHQDTQRNEIDCCSPFLESKPRECTQENTLGKVTEAGPIIQDGSADNSLTSMMALKASDSDMDNFKNLRDSMSVLVQSPESNTLNQSCFKESERLSMHSAEFVAENVGHHNDELHFESCLPTKCQADVSYVNATGSMEGSVTGKNELYLSTSGNTSFSARETSLRYENCNDGHGIGGYSADVIPNPSRVEPFPNTTNGEVSEDPNSSFSCLHPKSVNIKVEAAFTPNKKHGDGLDGKSCLSVLPQKAIPFSDEWLAAIEAAGEDILTKKSGAVQHSPPDKSLPEPGPWSPVKRKNNQIGPFDCTKFTNIAPFDSN